MQIEGPLSIAVTEAGDQAGRELQIDFTPEFRALDPDAQGARFQAYPAELGGEIARRPEDDPQRAGMLVIHQIGEQLLPHVVTGEMAINDPVVVEIGRGIGESASLSLTGFLR